jgi:hypothetical protein
VTLLIVLVLVVDWSSFLLYLAKSMRRLYSYLDMSWVTPTAVVMKPRSHRQSILALRRGLLTRIAGTFVRFKFSLSGSILCKREIFEDMTVINSDIMDPGRY